MSATQAARGPYSDVIRERWRRPRFRGELPGAGAVAEDVNPLCGDRVRLMLALEGERVSAARFVGDSCAICAASADVLAELVVGRSRAEALRVEATELYEAARDRVQRFIGAQHREEVIFTRGTTDGLSLLAETIGRTLRAGDEVLITELEHHSNIVPWQLATRDRGAVLKAVPLG